MITNIFFNIKLNIFYILVEYGQDMIRYIVFEKWHVKYKGKR